MTTRILSLLCAPCLAAVLAAPMRAGDFDGSRDLLCAPRDVVECDLAASCERVPTSEAEIPSFIRVEFKRKRLASVGGDERTTPIQNVERIEGATILQGAQNGRGWSIVIDHATGLLTASIADTDGTFAVLGACTPG